MRRLALSFASLFAVTSLGCQSSSEPGSGTLPAPNGSPNVPGATANAPLVRDFAERAQEIAAEYQAWGRVDDELRWAPFLCRQPMPGTPKLSESNHQATHGQKLYSVFAKDRAGYPETSAVGQVVVKESFVPEVVNADPSFSWNAFSQEVDADHFHPYATKDGVTYRAGAPAGLFLMFKLDPRTEATDRGWVYATVSTAGVVTSAGRVAACMTCHEEAKFDRLFGVPTGAYGY